MSDNTVFVDCTRATAGAKPFDLVANTKRNSNSVSNWYYIIDQNHYVEFNRGVAYIEEGVPKYKFIANDKYKKSVLKNLQEDYQLLYESFVEDLEIDFDYKQSDLKDFTFAKCSVCGEYVSYFGYSRVGAHNLVCDTCFEKEYGVCDSCHHIFKLKELHNGLCPDCSKKKFLLPYHKGEPDIVFRGNNKLPYLGVEIEVDKGGRRENIAKRAMDIMNDGDENLVWVSEDESIPDGMEIVTQPCTLQYHKKNKDKYDKLFKMLKSEKYKSDTVSTTGIHVHFNRDYFGDKEVERIYKLLFFVDKNYKDLIKFSRRKEKAIDKYAKAPTYPLSEYISTANKSGVRGFHYYGVNISNKDTIEIRYFKGTMKTEILFAILELVEFMAKVAKHYSFDTILQMDWDEIMDSMEYTKTFWESLED